MSKRKWTYKNDILTLTIGDDSHDYDLTDLFPLIAEFTDVQQKTIVYGAKQKLSDTLAGKSAPEYSAQEQFDLVQVLWERMCDGHFTLPTEGKITKEQGIQALMEVKELTREQATEIWDIMHKA